MKRSRIELVATNHPAMKKGKKYAMSIVETAARHLKSGWCKLADSVPEELVEAIEEAKKKAPKLEVAKKETPKT